jgi:hypothetical protein
VFCFVFSQHRYSCMSFQSQQLADQEESLTAAAASRECEWRKDLEAAKADLAQARPLAAAADALAAANQDLDQQLKVRVCLSHRPP